MDTTNVKRGNSTAFKLWLTIQGDLTVAHTALTLMADYVPCSIILEYDQNGKQVQIQCLKWSTEALTEYFERFKPEAEFIVTDYEIFAGRGF
jgi:hypothetical protein